MTAKRGNSASSCSGRGRMAVPASAGARLRRVACWRLSLLARVCRVIIRPLPNSPLLRVCYESDKYGSVRFQIRNERGSLLYDDVLRASRHAGTFDLADLPAGRYTVELQTPADHHEETIQVGKPIPAVVALVTKKREPGAPIQ